MDYIRQIWNVSKTESQNLSQNTLTFCSGIKLLDAAGIKGARAVGWFLSYENVSQFLETEEFDLDFAEFPGIENRLSRIAMRFIKLDAQRKNLALPTLEQDKNEILRMVMTKIFGPDYETSGFFVMRMARELPFQGSQTAHVKIARSKKKTGRSLQSM